MVIWFCECWKFVILGVEILKVMLIGCLFLVVVMFSLLFVLWCRGMIVLGFVFFIRLVVLCMGK